jgi:hypothetical protein
MNLFVLFLLPITTNAKPKLLLETNLNSKVIESDNVKARVFGLNTKALGRYIFNSSSKVVASAGLALETGSNESTIVDEFTPKQHVFLNKAYLKWRPFSPFNIKIGANNQDIYNSPLFLDSLAFFGVIESFSINNEILKIELFSQQAIPSNNTLTLRTGTVDEGTPFFIANTASMKLKGNILNANIQLTQFQFKNLSKSVAYNSQFFGNTVLGNLESNANFAYQFEGYNLAGGINYNINNNFGIKLLGQYLFNEKAPDNLSEAYLFKGSILIFNNKFSAGLFQIQRDATISYYNSSFYGHNNREGLLVGYEAVVLNDKTKLKVNYTSSEVIKSNIYQADSQSLFLELKTDFSIL